MNQRLEIMEKKNIEKSTKNKKNENIENNLNLKKKDSKRISLKDIEESDNNSKKNEILSKLCVYMCMNL
jgi:hypothetical protein